MTILRSRAMRRAVAHGAILLLLTGLALFSPRGAPAELTVDLTALDASWTAPGPTVYFLSRAVGSRRSLAPLRSPTPDRSGRFVIDLPASATFAVQQEYVLQLGGHQYPFTMPATAADLATLLSQQVEARPWAVGDSDPPTPRVGDLWVDTDDAELKFRAGGVWHQAGGGAGPGGGLTQSQVDARVKPFARTRGPPVAAADLADTVTDRIDGAVKIATGATPSLTGRDLAFLSTDESVTETLTLPGITVHDEGTLQGRADEPHTLDCRGPGVACTVTATTATLTVPIGPGEVDVRIRQHPDVAAALHTAEALEEDASLLAAVSVPVTRRNTYVRLGSVVLPAAERGANLEVDVLASTGVAPVTVSVPYVTLRAAARRGVIGAGIGTTGVEFSNGSIRFHVAVSAAAAILFASDKADTFRIALRTASLDVTDHLTACANDQILKRVAGAWACAADAVGQPGGGEANPAVATQAEARAGTETALRSWSPLRVREAVRAWAPSTRLTPDPSTYTSSDDGTFPAWDSGATLWTNGMMGDGNGFTWQWDAAESEWIATLRDATAAQAGQMTADQAARVARLPAAACATGQVPKWSGAAFTCQADATGGGGGAAPTVANVYPPAKQILVGGRGVTVAADDTARTLTLSAGVPVVSEVPEQPHFNERIILDQEDDFPGDYVDYQDEALETGTSIRFDYVGAPTPGPAYIICYTAEHGDTTPQTLLRNKCFVVVGGAYSMPAAAQARLYRSGGAPTWREVADSPVSGLTHWYEVVGLTYADISDSNYTYARNFRASTTATPLYPDATLEPGDYTYAGRGSGTSGWAPTPGTCDDWACRGNPARIPVSKLPATGFAPLTDGPGTGETITNSSQDRFLAQLIGFDPAFDLAAALNGHAIIEVVGTFTLSGRSTDTIGFNSGSNAANAQRRIDFAGIVQSSAVAASTVYNGSAARGIKVEGTAKSVYNGAAVLGEVAVYLGRTSGGLMGYVVGYDGSTGALGFSVGVDLTIIVQHSDPGQAAAGSSPVRVLIHPAAAISYPTLRTEVTFATAPAITAAQVGALGIECQFNGRKLTGAATGGGATVRIKRTRGAQTTTLDALNYGFTVGNGYVGTAATDYWGGIDSQVDWHEDDARVGDVYTCTIAISADAGRTFQIDTLSHILLFRE